ncbi:MAG: universal stress protein [Candidatus Aenigmarchaeota archaeon]|nr:universal stress protein [Candidatus Aenigmarchaeota archaeon]
MTISKILLPTDGSAFSERASKLAMELAKATGAEIVAVHVIEVKPPRLLGADAIEKLKAKRAETCFRKAGEDAERAGLRFEKRILVSRSVPGAIVNYIEDESPDIVVMGSKGLTGLKRIMMGSVTSAVLEKTTVPVLVVK